MSEPDLDRLVERSPLVAFWTLYEGREDAVRGHTYLLLQDDRARLAWLVHSKERTPAMLKLLKRWKERHPRTDPVADLRARTHWYPPAGRWAFFCDLGLLSGFLEGRTLSHERIHDLADQHLTLFPEDFVRQPVLKIVQDLLGQVTWPGELDAMAICPRFRAASIGDHRVVTGCRYGSTHADSGQDRTAAVWLSHDEGKTWSELPWKLPLKQRITPSGKYCWPPEQIDRVELVNTPEGLAPVIEWEDPWILFEPGDEWRASWKPDQGHWMMEKRGTGYW